MSTRIKSPEAREYAAERRIAGKARTTYLRQARANKLATRVIAGGAY